MRRGVTLFCLVDCRNVFFSKLHSRLDAIFQVAGEFVGSVNAGVIRLECELLIGLVLGVDGASASVAAGVVSSPEWNEG